MFCLDWLNIACSLTAAVYAMKTVKLKDTFDVVDNGDDVLREEVRGTAADMGSLRALEDSVDLLLLLFSGVRQVSLALKKIV